MEKIDKLDKIKGHHVALTRALARDKLPAKLRIQNKPIVMDSDNPKFQQKWRECIRTAERNMVKVLTDHLVERIQVVNHQIKDIIKRAFLALRIRANLDSKET